MASIKQNQLSAESTALQATTITSTVALAYRRGANQVLVIDNKSASPISPRLTGRSAPSDLDVSGVGDIDLSGGLSLGTIAAGAVAAVPLDSVYRWLDGQVELSSAVGAVAFVTTPEQVPQHSLWIQSGRLVATGRLTANSRLWG